MNSPIPDGLLVFADSHDVREENQDATIATLLACGATACAPCVLGQNGNKPAMDTLRRLQRACDAHAIALRPFAFPSVLATLRGMADARAWCTAVVDALGAPLMLDAEPQAGSHWTPRLLETWLAADERMSITTTRAEAPHLGEHDRVVYAQLEQQNSFATLGHAMRIFGAYTSPERIVLVSGAFNQPGDPRTVDEVRADLVAATPQARVSHAHGVWSAHTLSGPKCGAIKAWALATI